MRVVSLVPSHTETLHALGAWPDVVGVTSWCVHPEEARRDKRVVGGTKTPKVDRIIGLDPDVVIVCVEENPREAVDALEDAGVNVLVTDVRSVEDAWTAVRDIGKAVGREAEAEALAARIRDAHRQVREAAAHRAPVRAFCPIWRDPWMAFNGDTFAHDVLAACGVDNPWAGDDARYPETTLGEVEQRGVEAALLPSEPYEFTDDHVEEVMDHLGLRRERVALLDGEALTWYGARTPWGLREVLRVVDAVRPAPNE